jgi:Fur family zinc uptake transcriptional regulator
LTDPAPDLRFWARRFISPVMAGHHNHHDFAGDLLVDAARDALQTAGEQWTEMRSDVFEALAAHERPASAYDIAESVGARRGKRVAANSVYRILDLFVRTNLARRVESANAYVANSHPGCHHDCIFLICDACGEATHIDDDSLTGALRDAAHRAGFAAVRPVVEIRGRCGACGAEADPA